MVYREADEARDLKIKAREAVELAMSGRWAEAIAVNSEIIATSSSDLGAYNRLGKALLELGDPEAARAAFEHSLALDPSNQIARKNIERLSEGMVCGGSASLSHKMFIGEVGKSAQVELLGCAADASRPYLAAGSAIELRVHNGNLVAYSVQGQYVGIVPPKRGRRLAVLMEGGNRYEGAVVNSGEATVSVVLHESYQHPSLRSKTSFPAMAAELPVLAPLLELETIQPLLETPSAELGELRVADTDGIEVAEPAGEVTEMAPWLDSDEADEENAFEEVLEKAI